MADVTITGLLVGPVTISPMSPDERHWVLDSYMRGSHWARSKIERAVEDGTVLVARGDDPFAYGWLCVLDGAVAHGYVKHDFRDLGIMRALWEVAGRPARMLDPSTRRGRRVLKHLAEAEK